MAGRFLDTEIQHPTGVIPDDQKRTGVIGEALALYDPYRAIDRRSLRDLDNNAALIRILRNTDVELSLKTIGNAFFPKVISIGTSPTLIIEPNRAPRGYKLLNPNTVVSGVATNVTVFAAATVFPNGTTNSASFSVAAHGGAAFIFNVTEATAGPFTVNLQTLDPISGNWATAQSDIFSGAIAVGTYYANVGAVGIDDIARLNVVNSADSLTGSIAAILKPALAGTVAGPAVFLGGENVNTTIGYPLLGGSSETFFLKENTALYAVAVAATNVNLFELQ